MPGGLIRLIFFRDREQFVISRGCWFSPPPPARACPMAHLNLPAATSEVTRQSLAEMWQEWNDDMAAAFAFMAARPPSETAVAASHTAVVATQTAGAVSETGVIASETAIVASQKAGAASETAGAASETAVAAAQNCQIVHRAVPRESGALRKGTLQERVQNKLMMEARRDILANTIKEYDQSNAAFRKTDPTLHGRPVHVPSPSHRGTFEEEMRFVRTRLRWLQRQIGLESVQIVQGESAFRAGSAPMGEHQKRAGSAPTGEPQQRKRAMMQQLLPGEQWKNKEARTDDELGVAVANAGG